MENGRVRSASLVPQALAAAAIMMAWQWAGKTTRDSLFLSEFPSSALPAMMGGAALCSLLTATLNAALLRRFGPARIIPVGYAAGTALHLIEWALLPKFPHLIAVIVYLHIVALGSVLLSGFWALANERFDPRQARRHFGQIAAAGTLGTLAGGVMAERVAALASLQSLLLLLGVLQLLCAIALFRFAPAREAAKHAQAPSFPEVISGAPYLMGLAGLVVLAAMSASTLDYLFKASAAAHFEKGAPLTRFFAIFNTTTALIAFAVQMGINRRWLGRFGPGPTVATLPMAVTGASVLTIFAPGLAALTFSRALEILLRGSLYRSGYELFYTPMPEAEKRSIKSVIDIGAERLGDGLAGASVQLLLTLPSQAAVTAILGLTGALAAAGAWIALRLDRVYVKVLERGLAHHADNVMPAATGKLEELDSQALALSMASTTGTFLGPGEVIRTAVDAALPVTDPAIQTLVELRSDSASRIRAALQRPEALSPVVTPQVIRLLDRDDVAQAAFDTLCRCGDGIAGQLVDGLLDPTNSFNIRKRIPKVLSSFRSRLAWDGLSANLLDARFEVRTRCARALERIAARQTSFALEQSFVFDVVRHELAHTRKLVPGTSTGASGMRTALMERKAKTVAHIFTLLGLVLPRRPVRQAFRALQADGTRVKGVALEYLDSILPKDLRKELTAYLEGLLPPPSNVPSEEAVAQLLDENPSIMHRLEYWVAATKAREETGHSNATQNKEKPKDA